MDKPRICEVLGVEVDENFKFNDFPFDECKVYFVGTDGEIRNAKGGSVTGGELCYIINNPDRIIRKPHWTEREVKAAEAILALWPDATILEDGRPYYIRVHGKDKLLTTVGLDLFPSLGPGESVTLTEVIHETH